MIHVFIGTKAQLIKMAPIMRELQLRGVEYNFIFSGQHQNTIKELRGNFGIKDPDFMLHKGKDVTSIFYMGWWLVKIILVSLVNKKKLSRGHKGGVVLNHGDTFSTLAGSILARLAGQKNAHVESGLRSFNFMNPFPEEITRVAVFLLSNIYFCPNKWAENNLTSYRGEKINTNGNTLYDALTYIQGLHVSRSVDIPDVKYCVVSFHRFENIFQEGQLDLILSVIGKISASIRVLVIMHKPTLVKLKDFGRLDELEKNKNIELRPRYDYLDFIALVSSSEFVVTDGGSNQEECFYLGKPCLLLRRATERTEGLGLNVVLSKFEPHLIADFVQNYEKFKTAPVVLNPSPTKIIVDSVI